MMGDGDAFVYMMHKEAEFRLAYRCLYMGTGLT
jgi:hypothetical protein